jgi:hypothetical protein
MTALSSKIRESPQHHKTLVMFMRLSVLPLERADAGLSALVILIEDSSLTDHFGAFVEYFTSTWSTQLRYRMVD